MVTRRLLHTVLLFGILLQAFLLSSCGEDYLDQKRIVPHLGQEVYMIPDGYSEEMIGTELYPFVGTTAEKGQSVRFAVVHNINGERLSSNDAGDVYKSFFWEIDGEYFNLETFRYTFKRSGIVNGKLTTIDNYDDSLITNFTIQVNAPETFTLDFPYDGFNQAEPCKPVDLPLRWTITGIDEWETASCEVFLSTQPESLYVSKIASIDCMENANLWGPLVGDSAELYKKGYDLRKESITFYWTVRYTIHSNEKTSTPVYSPVYHFSTKYLNNNISTLRVPITYKGFVSSNSLTPFNTAAYVVNAVGDTLKTYTGTQPDQEMLFNLPPQNGIKIYFEEKSKKEYKAEPIQVDLLPGTVVTAGPVIFVDTIPPQIEPTKYNFLSSFYPIFRIYDDGSGVDESSIKLYVDNIAFTHDISGNEITVKTNRCEDRCIIRILATDNAGNELPAIDWNVTNNKEGLYHVERIL